MADVDAETVDLVLVGDVTVEAAAWTEGSDRRIEMVIDKPPALGGTDRGAMPSEYLLAAIGSCTLMTARRIADKRGVSYRALRCRAIAYLAGADIERVHLVLTVDSDADAAAWDTVFRLAERTCTISRAVSCPIEREVRIQAD